MRAHQGLQIVDPALGDVQLVVIQYLHSHQGKARVLGQVPVELHVNHHRHFRRLKEEEQDYRSWYLSSFFH